MKIDIVDLKKNLQYLEQYMKLRNSYKDELFTKSVAYEETKKWVQNDLNFVKIAIKDEVLLGVVILYLTKNNEVTIFTKEKNKGIGTLLLIEIEKYAFENNLKYIYSWVEKSNKVSTSLFLKQKFSLLKQSNKEYNDIQYAGNIFQKEF